MSTLHLKQDSRAKWKWRTCITAEQKPTFAKWEKIQASNVTLPEYLPFKREVGLNGEIIFSCFSALSDSRSLHRSRLLRVHREMIRLLSQNSFVSSVKSRKLFCRWYAKQVRTNKRSSWQAPKLIAFHSVEIVPKHIRISKEKTWANKST